MTKVRLKYLALWEFATEQLMASSACTKSRTSMSRGRKN